MRYRASEQYTPATLGQHSEVLRTETVPNPANQREPSRHSVGGRSGWSLGANKVSLPYVRIS